MNIAYVGTPLQDALGGNAAGGNGGGAGVVWLGYRYNMLNKPEGLARWDSATNSWVFISRDELHQIFANNLIRFKTNLAYNDGNPVPEPGTMGATGNTVVGYFFNSSAGYLNIAMDNRVEPLDITFAV